MSFMKWDPSFSVGVDVIDNQHKRIFDYINLLETAVREKDQSGIKHVLDEMVDYTLTHFSFEESLMEKGDYPYYDAHKHVHDSFAARVSGYREKFEKGENVGQRLLSDLRIWLTNHIKRDDRDYAPYVQKTLKKDDAGGWLSKTLKKFFG